MSIPNRYASATAFRRALETRLKTIAMDEHVDVQRLRRQIAFDRFLCRLFQLSPGVWVLKGGYAMELRIRQARTTKDIDLTFRKKADNEDVLLDNLQDAAALDLEDGFEFIVGEPMMELDGAPYGGARYPVETRMDGRVFVNFHLDAGMGDSVLEPVETITPRDWLAFANIHTVSFPALPAEQQFAEKYHAYTLTRKGRPNSRVRDLVDMVLLLHHTKLDADRLTESLKATFERRGTHDLPMTVPEPPEFWVDQFDEMAKACGIEISIEEAIEQIEQAITHAI